MIQARTPIEVICRIVAVFAIFLFLAMLLVSDIIVYGNLWGAIKHVAVGGTAAVIFVFILNRYLWKISLIQKALNIPNVDGRWEGWYFNTVDYEWRPTAHEIQQKGYDLTAIAYGGAGKSTPGRLNTSISIVCGMAIAQNAKIGENRTQVHWTYRTENSSDVGGNHNGTHIMTLSNVEGAHFLEGGYFNDRKIQLGAEHDSTKGKRAFRYGSSGFILVKKTSKPLAGGLSFNEASWAIPRPPDGVDPAIVDFGQMMLRAVKK